MREFARWWISEFKHGEREARVILEANEAIDGPRSTPSHLIDFFFHPIPALLLWIIACVLYATTVPDDAWLWGMLYFLPSIICLIGYGIVSHLEKRHKKSRPNS
jgi:hypothetical protein